jgi:predicted AAA+ superfamily ATPase
MSDRNFYKKTWQKLSSYKSMIFIAGPRQAGKTTFAKAISKDFTNKLYFNWDTISDKKKLIANPYFFQELNRVDKTTPLVIFDEIHKYDNWKNYLKGVFDEFGKDYKFLISGSGRLDLFQKGGDSLAGRYFLFYLWTFTLAELSNNNVSFKSFIKNPIFIPKKDKKDQKIWNRLKKFSGFPEPYLKAKNDFYKLWSNTYIKQLIREDVRNASQIKNIDNTEILYSILPEKIGSPLSLNNLAQNLHVSFDSIKSWLSLFERFFLIFKVSPWKKRISRAIVKEQKIYLFNYPIIEDASFRFENMVALELYRAISNWNNLGLGDFSLHFIRNKEKEEVDFLLVNNRKPFLLIECKFTDTNISKNLVKFQNILKIPAIQLVDKEGICKKIKNTDSAQYVLIVSACDWLARLP